MAITPRYDLGALEVVPHRAVVDDPGVRRRGVRVSRLQVQVEVTGLALELAPVGSGVAGGEVLHVAEDVHAGRDERRQDAAASRAAGSACTRLPWAARTVGTSSRDGWLRRLVRPRRRALVTQPREHEDDGRPPRSARPPDHLVRHGHAAGQRRRAPASAAAARPGRNAARAGCRARSTRATNTSSVAMRDCAMPSVVGGGEAQGDERPRRRQAEPARQRVDAGRASRGRR